MGGGDMNGLAELVQLRREGIKPAAVFLLDYPAGKPWPVVEQIREGAIPGLHVAGEIPALADCRVFVGMRVHLHCDDDQRAVAWVDRLLTDGASHVVQTTGKETFQWRQ